MAASKKLPNPIKKTQKHVVGILQNEAKWLYIVKIRGIRK
jgi:hypothetical protein